MGMRFRKSIKIGKYLRLNISKSGISASIGKQGATINVGGKGTYLNLSPSLVGVKGTGVSYRQRLTGGYGNILELITGQVANKNNKKEAAKQIEDKANVELVNVDDVDKYNEILETNINLHKYADNLISEDALKKRIDDFEDAESKEVYQKAIKQFAGCNKNHRELDIFGIKNARKEAVKISDNHINKSVKAQKIAKKHIKNQTGNKSDYHTVLFASHKTETCCDNQENIG